jgi:hypothetical protein
VVIECKEAFRNFAYWFRYELALIPIPVWTAMGIFFTNPIGN